MSKKDKEKRKKGEGSSTGVSAWMGDLRPPRSATATRARSSSHPPAASPLTRGPARRAQPRGPRPS